jgi:hypothetical protein
MKELKPKLEHMMDPYVLQLVRTIAERDDELNECHKRIIKIQSARAANERALVLLTAEIKSLRLNVEERGSKLDENRFIHTFNSKAKDKEIEYLQNYIKEAFITGFKAGYHADEPLDLTAYERWEGGCE